MSTVGARTQRVGRFALVLHTHLPWLTHHGTWPVGEEWLHQAWGTSYLRVLDVLTRLGNEGMRDVLTLGVTPVLAAQWDDPHVIAEQRRWLAHWQTRASGMANAAESDRRTAGRREFAEATWALELFERDWASGGSAALRPLVDAGVVELLSGPLTHSFTPLLPDALARATLTAGMDDTAVRLGTRPTGMWTPECAYAPGLESIFAQAGVTHLMLDGPSLLGAGADTHHAWRLGESDVAVVGRDLEVTYRVWSPRRGYPGDRWYRDFHTFDHEWGFRTARVTGHTVEPGDKAPYDAGRAADSVARDATDFVDVVRRRLLDLSDGQSSPLVVAAFDTELFGHWWHEGPDWLERVLRAMPEAGIEVVTMQQAARETAGAVFPQPGSWGLHKDWHIWTDPHEIADRQQGLTKEVLAALRTTHPRNSRSTTHDQLVRELLLALSSDWAFMVSHDSAADYARRRFHDHAERAQSIVTALMRADAQVAEDRAHRAFAVDHPFGLIDARRFMTRDGFAERW